MSPRHIAIIGAGYSGTLQAINLLRHSDAAVTLIERRPQVARGAAYSTPHADHLLNVRAAKMSAFADVPSHFADWLAERGAGDGSSFAERRLYGGYLEELLKEAAAEAGGRLGIVQDEAVEVVRDDRRERVELSSGKSVSADAVVLSIGNLPPARPSIIPENLQNGLYVEDPWSADLSHGLSHDDEVLLLGTGLTAIDAALMLESSGFGGRILAMSRRGMVPRAHAEPPEPVPELAHRLDRSLSKLTRAVREDGDRIGWQAAVDRLRPHTQPLWASASVEERQRFLRHLRPYWDVHRHRIAPEIARRVAEMEMWGRLSFTAGKLVSVKTEGKGLAISWRRRASHDIEELRVRMIVNCTGPRGDVSRSGERLLDQLVSDGRIRPDPLRIGIDIDASCRAIGSDGAPASSLYAIGPMARGALWEIVAVPDIRVQTDQLAREIAAVR